MIRALFVLVLATVVASTASAAGPRAIAPEPSFADFLPRVSPDGTRIAFLRYGVTPLHLVRDPSLYVGGVSGRSTVAFTKGSTASASNRELGHYDAVTGVTWSSDGAQLVFAHTYAGSRYDIPRSELVVMDAPGTAGDTLFIEPSPFFRAYSPAWSAANNRIAFAGGDSSVATGGIWLVSMTGAGLTQLTTGNDSEPAWSPDGKEIAFVRGDNLALVPSNGGTVSVLPVKATSPAWSPDGRTIVVATVAPNPDIYAVDPSTASLRRLTTNPAADVTPTFTPDGSSIVFASERGRGKDSGSLWIMNADGSRERRLVAAPKTRAANGRRCSVVGTAAADVLVGLARADVLCGFAWRDKLTGGAGPDVLDGGPGPDVLDGGAGDDLILARDGRKDVVRGGPGFDRARVDRADTVSGVERLLR